MYLVA
jgi:hypothetical protein